MDHTYFESGEAASDLSRGRAALSGLDVSPLRAGAGVFTGDTVATPLDICQLSSS